ncbi:MAG: aldehyde ferredoxin oxidoreductase N-terminal domain-containing protein [Desulfobacteraceae bacterium]|jgi:aldehyde:ferredoxin oxidoreductase
MYGWTGKIPDVDLNTAQTCQIDTQKYSGKYIGGRGIASRIFRERVMSQTGAFDPQNHLILMTGPLVAEAPRVSGLVIYANPIASLDSGISPEPHAVIIGEVSYRVLISTA